MQKKNRQWIWIACPVLFLLVWQMVVEIIDIDAVLGSFGGYKPAAGTLETKSCQVAGSFISGALCRYFSMNSEFPCHLVGDHRTPITRSLILGRNKSNDWHCVLIKGNHPFWLSRNRMGDSEDNDIWRHIKPKFRSSVPDPLIHMGCVVGYPVYDCEIGYIPSNTTGSRRILEMPPLKYGWRCAVSTPGYNPIPAGESRDSVQCLLALGGWGYSNLGRMQMTYVYGPEDRPWMYDTGKQTPVFGYQRGEHLGLDSSVAWLWMYHPEEISRTGSLDELHGLDVLNATTGEIIPDGIPDGICILYKLKDGEVVEVIHADDIKCE